LQLLGSSGPRRGHSGGEEPRSTLTSILPHIAIFVGVVAAWAILALNRSQAITRVVPLEIRGVTDAIAVDPPRQSSVTVELRSSRRELEQLPAHAVEAYVELQDNSFGTHVYHVHARAPAGIEVAGFVPDTVQIVSHPRAPQTAPPNLHGETVTGRRPSGATTPAREDSGSGK
jgi:hypothetical protein